MHSGIALLLFIFTRCIAAATWVVPGVAGQANSSPPISTDVRVLNQGDAPTNAVFTLIPISDAAPAPVTRSIQPGQTLRLTGLLQVLWGVDSAGTLQITADQPLLIIAQSIVASGTGNLTAELHAINYDDLTVAGNTAHAIWLAHSADPSTGFRSTIGVVLMVAQTSVDVVLYDPAGTELARRSVQGGPAVRELPAGDLLGSDLPVGRVAFQVKAGRATGYLNVTDKVSGDPMIVPAGPLLDSVSTVLPAVSHLANPDGSLTRTDVRLYNPLTSRSGFSFTLLAPTLAELPATENVVLNAGETREIPDVLATLFNASDSVQAAVLVQGNLEMGVAARTLTLSAGQSGGGTGSYLPVDAPLLVAQAGGSVLGVQRPPATTLGFVAVDGGGTAGLLLRADDGTVLATLPAAVTLEPNSWSEFTPDALFPGVTMPDDATIDILPTAGTVLMYTRTTDPSSGDVAVGAAQPALPYTCAPPAISSFTASPSALTAGGGADLFWSVAGADSIQISPGVGAVVPSGTQHVTAASTTSYTLQATGICGAASATATITIGAPAVVSVKPAAAQPGQKITIQVRNADDPASIPNVQFALPNLPPVLVAVDSADASGNLMVTAPAIATSAAGQLYTGPLQIQLPSTGTSTLAGIPFTLQAMTYPGDPVKDMQALVDQMVQQNQATAARLAQVPDLAANAPLLLQFTSEYAGVLQKMLSDVAASGTAVVPISSPASTPGGPPDTVTVTRAMIMQFMSMYTNEQAAASSGLLRPRLTEFAPAPRALDDAGQPRPCLRDDADYAACRDTIAFNNPNSPGAAIVKLLLAAPSAAACVGYAPAIAFTVVAAYIQFLGQMGQVACYVKPVVLDRFLAAPEQPGYIRGGPNSTAVTMEVRLVSMYSSRGELENDVIDAFRNTLVNALGNCASFLGTALDTQISKGTASLKAWIEKSIPAAAVSQPVVLPVYKCDLARVEPREALVVAVGSPGSRDDAAVYYFVGRQKKRSALNVVTKPDHFVYLSGKTPRLTAERVSSTTTRPASVDVRGPHHTLKVTSQTIEFGLQKAINTQDALEVDTYNPVASSAGAGATGQVSYKIQQVNDTTWDAQFSASAVNNEPVGSTYMYVVLDTGLLQSVLPVRSQINYTSQGVVMPFTDTAGHPAIGQMSSRAGFTASCLTGGPATNTTVSNNYVGSFTFNPGPFTCPNTENLQTVTDLDGVLGAFQASASIRIQMEDSDTPVQSGVAGLPPKRDFLRRWIPRGALMAQVFGTR